MQTGPSTHKIATQTWGLDPQVDFLNHGSFGACPRAVLAAQARLREQLEREPVRFFMREMEPQFDAARQALAGVLGANVENLVFVRNVTAGVNAVLRSLQFAPGDEILVTNHGYNACRNVVDYVAGRSGARAVVVDIPMPLTGPCDVLSAVMRAVGARTRLALLDHVTSPTGVVFPIEELVSALAANGVDTLVDGAHAPGMIPLHIERLGAAYYAGNCHKWLCAPKGAGFLWARPDRHDGLQPPVISHGYNTRRPGRSQFHDAFDWPGTDDLTSWLCVADAIAFLEGLEGGLAGQMARNHALAVEGRRVLCKRLGIAPPCPESMLGSLAALPLGPDPHWPADRPVDVNPPSGPTPLAELQTWLLRRHGIEAPLYYWPKPPHRWFRISAQAYNTLAQYRRLADVLVLCHSKNGGATAGQASSGTPFQD